MSLLRIVVSYLPKKYQDKYIQKQWGKKSDASIMAAYKDATEWIEISKGIMSTPTIRDIASDCQDRLDKFIMPQVNKRGLL